MIKRINILIVVFIILCSTSFYKLTVLGPAEKVIELAGAGIILALLILHIVYGNQKSIKQNFLAPVAIILASLPFSMLMAKFCRDQTFIQSMFAQRAIYYYIFYLLLHYLKVRPKDLERIFIVLGLLHVALYFIQYFLYPKIIFNVFILHGRGTVRVYLGGAGYLVISYFMSIQAYFRTNKTKYLVLILLFFSIFILLGGRQTLAIMTFLLILFVIVDKKVKSKVFNGILIMAAVVTAFFMFQGIIEQLILQSLHDKSQGEDYIRILAYKYFLSDFYKCPLAYITGNGTAANHTAYSRELGRLAATRGYYLSDIGLAGNYVAYGVLFLIGVLTICIKALRIKIEKQYDYFKYMFISIVLALPIGRAFAVADFICFISLAMYIFDVSINRLKTSALTN
ncbi:hypothetical protein ES705_20754 [subsurface metagenome]